MISANNPPDPPDLAPPPQEPSKNLRSEDPIGKVICSKKRIVQF